jgi:hypothetical protein
MSLPSKNKFDPSFPIVEKDGKPTQFFRNYLFNFDQLITAIMLGGLPGNLVSAVDDAAAAAAGVPLGGLYRSPTSGVAPHTSSSVQVRVS